MTERSRVVKPGIYRDVAFETYVEWDAVNNSLLNGFTRTPAHVRYEMLHGRGTSESKELGRALHLAVLEPRRFANEVVVAPEGDGRKREVKAAWAALRAEHPTATVISADNHRAVCSMRDSLLKQETAGLFLTSRGHNEVSIVWEESEAGVLCKARLDRVGEINGATVIGDIKTDRDASPRGFERSIASHGYARQCVHYTAGLQKLKPAPEPRKFIFFVVESAPPYPVACYQIDPESLAFAEEQRQGFLRTYRECMTTGAWPGYASGVQDVSLPAWLMKSWHPEGDE